jgi:hypothetical protein
MVHYAVHVLTDELDWVLVPEQSQTRRLYSSLHFEFRYRWADSADRVTAVSFWRDRLSGEWNLREFVYDTLLIVKKKPSVLQERGPNYFLMNYAAFIFAALTFAHRAFCAAVILTFAAAVMRRRLMGPSLLLLVLLLPPNKCIA